MRNQVFRKGLCLHFPYDQKAEMQAGHWDEVALERHPAKVPGAQRLLCAAFGILQAVSGIGASHPARPDEGKEAGALWPSRGLSPKGAHL